MRRHRRRLPRWRFKDSGAAPAKRRPCLFVASGSNDNPRFREPALDLIAHWSGRDSTPWDLRTTTLEGHSHFSAAPAAFRQGLSWLSAEP